MPITPTCRIGALRVTVATMAGLGHLAVALAIVLSMAGCGARKPAERKVLFVGLDGADWQLLDGYMASGVMPNLARLAREGRTGALTTLTPPLSPLVWTTMMTGVSPLRHGILDFTRVDPGSCAVEPIRSEDRRAPALWNIATSRKKSVAVFGLWATYPAETVNGLLVSDRFQSFTSKPGSPGLPPGTVFPAERQEWAQEGLAQGERELDAEALRTYLPWISDADAEAARSDPDPYAHPAAALRRILLETRTYHRLAAEWIREHHPDLSLVYFQGTDTLGHVFAPYAPPRQASISEEEYGRFSGVPELYFREIDRMLGDYRQLAEEEGAALIIASDHGFLWGAGRPAQLSSAAAPTAGRWHRFEGISLLWGPGVEPAAERGRGSVRQLAATLLAALGLPPGKTMEAEVLAGLRPSKEPAQDYSGTLARDSGVERPIAADPAAVAKLKSLGYVAGSAGSKLSRGCPDAPRTPASFNNEGLLRRLDTDIQGAQGAFEHALALDPKNVAAMANLSELLDLETGQAKKAEELLFQAFATGLPDGTERIAAKAQAIRQQDGLPAAAAYLGRALERKPGTAPLLLLRGRFFLEDQSCPEAERDLLRVTQLMPNDALAHATLGLSRLCLGEASGAAAALRRSLELDPNQPQVRSVLGELDVK